MTRQITAENGRKSVGAHDPGRPGTGARLAIEKPGIVRLLAATAVMAVVAVSFSSVATAQQQPLCTERSEVLSQLSSQYAEAPVAMGIANNGGVLEILSSRSGGSWTIILTMPNGVACMIAAGENWESLPDISRVGSPS